MLKLESLSVDQWIVIGTLALMALEMALIRAGLVRGHFAWRDTLASVAMRIGNYASNLLLAGAVVATFSFLYAHRLFDISPASPWAWAALVVLDDLAYYVFHRASHECRFWWAAHVNHHSSQEYNLSTAIRQTWTGVLVGTWAPWFPLALLGFPPEMIFLQSGISLLVPVLDPHRDDPPAFSWYGTGCSERLSRNATTIRHATASSAISAMYWSKQNSNIILWKRDAPTATIPMHPPKQNIF